MQVWCDWQLTLCDPHLSALEVRFHDDALYKSMFTFTLTVHYNFIIRSALTVQTFKDHARLVAQLLKMYSILSWLQTVSVVNHLYCTPCPSS